MKKPPKSYPISEFKAKALALLQYVYDSGQTITVTKHNKTIVKITPVGNVGQQKLNQLAETVVECGDLVSPAIDPDDWDMLKS